MTLKELFTTYWSQFTLILLGLGYLIKYVLDLIFKKREINFTILQNRKLDSINKFFSRYAKVESMWLDLAIYPILRGEVKADEIDIIIFSSINEFKSSVFEVKIYTNDEENEKYDLLYENMMLINKKLNSLYMKTTFSGIKPTKVSDEVNVFSEFRDTVLKKNLLIISDICKELKKTYK
jgi:hypothetical protein